MMAPSVAVVVTEGGEEKLQLLFAPISEYRLLPTAAKMLMLDGLFTPAIAVIFGELEELTAQEKEANVVASTFDTTLTVPTLDPTTRPGVEPPLRNVPNAVTPSDPLDEVQDDRVLALVMAKQSAGVEMLNVWRDPAWPFGRGTGVLEVLLLPEQAERVTRSARKRTTIFRERPRSGLSFKKTIFMGRHPRFGSVECCFGSLPEHFHRAMEFGNFL
jgi:hypothetical protein